MRTVYTWLSSRRSYGQADSSTISKQLSAQDPELAGRLSTQGPCSLGYAWCCALQCVLPVYLQHLTEMGRLAVQLQIPMVSGPYSSMLGVLLK